MFRRNSSSLREDGPRVSTPCAGIAHFFPIKNDLVVDLRTGEVSTKPDDDMFPFSRDFGMGTGKYREDVNQVFEGMMGSPEAAIYLQMMAGSFLTGEVDDPSIHIIAYGSESSGKSLFFNVMKRILGPYYSGNGGGCTSPVMDRIRVGGRTVARNTKRLAVHTLVGREPAWGNSTRNSPRSDVKTQTRSVMIADCVVAIRDDVIKETLMFIPFPMSFIDDPVFSYERLANKSLPDKMMGEWIEDVFAWAVEGAVAFYRNGKRIDVPPCVIKDKDAYVACSKAREEGP